jgi:hypothetical protein
LITVVQDEQAIGCKKNCFSNIHRLFKKAPNLITRVIYQLCVSTESEFSEMSYSGTLDSNMIAGHPIFTRKAKLVIIKKLLELVSARGGLLGVQQDEHDDTGDPAINDVVCQLDRMSWTRLSLEVLLFSI